jgi:hypothetical protein
MVPNIAIGSLKNSIKILIFLLELTNTNVGFVVNIVFFIQNKVCFFEPKTWEKFEFFGLNF